MEKKVFKPPSFIKKIPTNNIWVPPHNIPMLNIKSNSWHTLKESNSNNIVNFDPLTTKKLDVDSSIPIPIKKKKVFKSVGRKSKKDMDLRPGEKNTSKTKKITKKVKEEVIVPVATEEEPYLIKVKQIKILPTERQDRILQKWFTSFIKMYNEALKYMKRSKIYSFGKVRKNTYNIKQDIIRNSITNNESKTQFGSHELDLAIKMACTAYKTSFENLKKKHIKHFRIKYWKYNRKVKVIKLEKSLFKDEIFKGNKIGVLKGYYNNDEFKFKEIQGECTLKYNDFTKEYVLHAPVKYYPINPDKPNKIISLDPGIRTFLTGISENKVIKIGDNLGDKISKLLLKIDEVRSHKNMFKRNRQKKEYKLSTKITNCINEMHWKTIKYLTKNYKTILIGDMSCKSIVSNETSVLSDMTKRIALRMKLYEFRQRLSNACKGRGNNYKCVDESYTSKVCSCCGFIKEDLGGDKVYNCDKCKKQICRDTNGARNIYLKSSL